MGRVATVGLARGRYTAVANRLASWQGPLGYDTHLYRCGISKARQVIRLPISLISIGARMIYAAGPTFRAAEATPPRRLNIFLTHR